MERTQNRQLGASSREERKTREKWCQVDEKKGTIKLKGNKDSILLSQQPGLEFQQPLHIWEGQVNIRPRLLTPKHLSCTKESVTGGKLTYHRFNQSVNSCGTHGDAQGLNKLIPPCSILSQLVKIFSTLLSWVEVEGQVQVFFSSLLYLLLFLNIFFFSGGECPMQPYSLEFFPNFHKSINQQQSGLSLPFSIIPLVAASMSILIKHEKSSMLII